jgi:hypothetical protein
VIILAIKLLHSLIFFFLSGCILYILYCGITNRYSTRTTIAIILVSFEGLLLAINDWKCPLTTLAQSLGAPQADVASLFLPRWFADHIFGICTPLFIGSCVLLLIRLLIGRRVYSR